MGLSKFAERSAAIPATLFSLWFLLAGLAVLPYPGIQNDEAIFVSPLYPPYNSVYKISNIPVMLMDYLGCLKTWLYAPVFALFPPSAWSIRFPVILLGALSIILFTVLLRRIGGSRAAWIGAALLATDPVFVLTNDFDWGPVALQHFLFLSGLLAIVLHHITRRAAWLAVAGFSFGLALWDKALFVWLLVPLCVAGVLLWPREVRAALNRRTVFAVLTGFIIGAAPLLWFNFKHHGVTLRSHAAFTFADIPAKLQALHYTANGSVMFGYMVQGDRSADLLEWGFGGALCLLPFVWRTQARRPALLCLFVMCAAWVQMALTRDAGQAAHHVILLWPLPQFLIAVVLAQFRRAGVAVTLILAVANALTCHQYWSNLRREGTTQVWTDAINVLASDRILSQADLICVMDWGIIDPLQVLQAGRLRLLPEFEAVMPEPTGKQTELLLQHLHDPKTVWISHIDGQEVFSGINKRLEILAEAQSLIKVSIRVYTDTHGRPTLEAFRFTSR